MTASVSRPAPVIDLLGGARSFALEVAGHEQVPLVVQFAPLGQGDLHLGPAILEVQGYNPESDLYSLTPVFVRKEEL